MITRIEQCHHKDTKGETKKTNTVGRAQVVDGANGARANDEAETLEYRANGVEEQLKYYDIV